MVKQKEFNCNGNLKLRPIISTDLYSEVSKWAEIIECDIPRKTADRMLANCEIREFLENRGIIKDADEITICIYQGKVCEVIGDVRAYYDEEQNPLDPKAI